MENSEKLSRKEKRELVENNLLARVYDLILNEQTSEEERSILVEFKNAVERLFFYIYLSIFLLFVNKIKTLNSIILTLIS